MVGESRLIRLPARANPAVRRYTWSRDGAAADVAPPTSADGVMNLTSVRRADAGWYRLEAINALGSAAARVHVDVLCEWRGEAERLAGRPGCPADLIWV